MYEYTLINILFHFIIVARSNFERYVIRKLSDIGFQLSSLQEQGKVLNSRLHTILQYLQTSVSHGIEDETAEQDIMNNFPFETMEDLNAFEKLLIENQINRKRLVSTAKIGINCVCVYI